MSDAPDLANLSKRFCDLWQDQITAMAADRELAEALMRMMALFQGSAVPGASAFGAAGAPSPDGADSPTRGAAYAAGYAAGFQAGLAAATGTARSHDDDALRAAAGSPPFAAASGDGAGGLDELRSRLAALETRLADLEGGTPPPGGSPRGRTRRSRS